MKTIKLYHEITVSNVQCFSKQDSTFSVGGGGVFTVSASSTLKGSSTLSESVVRYLPFFGASDTLNLQKSESKENPILLLTIFILFIFQPEIQQCRTTHSGTNNPKTEKYIHEPR